MNSRSHLIIGVGVVGIGVMMALGCRPTYSQAEAKIVASIPSLVASEVALREYRLEPLPFHSDRCENPRRLRFEGYLDFRARYAGNPVSLRVFWHQEVDGDPKILGIGALQSDGRNDVLWPTG